MDLKRGSEADVTTLGELEPGELFQHLKVYRKTREIDDESGWPLCDDMDDCETEATIKPTDPVRRIRAALYTEAAIEEEVERRVREVREANARWKVEDERLRDVLVEVGSDGSIFHTTSEWAISILRHWRKKIDTAQQPPSD